MKIKPFLPQDTPYIEIVHSRRRVSKVFSLGFVVEHQKKAYECWKTFESGDGFRGFRVISDCFGALGGGFETSGGTRR